MKSKILIFHLLLFQLFIFIIKAQETIEAKCSSICSCKEKKKDFNVEFRVICEGNGTKNLTLGDTIFEDEELDEFSSRRVYVRIDNFSMVNITESFLLKWLSYVSCSFDIWSIKRVVFPKEIKSMSKNTLNPGQFAGIGIADSHLDDFPSGLMQGKETVGIRMFGSKMTHIDIGSTLGKFSNLNYLEISNSTVGVLDSSLSSKIPLGYSFKKGEPSIMINNSNIGMVDRGGLAFQNYSYEYSTGKASVVIEDSTLGVVTTESMYFGNRVKFNMTNANIGVLLASAISIEDNIEVTIKNSTVGVKENALTSLECLGSTNIFNNSFLSLDMKHRCENNSTCEENKLFNFVHSSCNENTLLILNTNEGTGSGHGSDNGNKELPTGFKNLHMHKFSSLVQKLDQEASFPDGLFYIIAAIALFLFIVVIVLLAIIAFRKDKPKPRRESVVADDIYDPFPAPVYYSPKIPSPVNSRKVSRASYGHYPEDRIAVDFDNRTEQVYAFVQENERKVSQASQRYSYM